MYGSLAVMSRRSFKSLRPEVRSPNHPLHLTIRGGNSAFRDA